MEYETGDLVRIVKFLPRFSVPPGVEVGQIRRIQIRSNKDRLLIELGPDLLYLLFREEVELYYRPKKEDE